MRNFGGFFMVFAAFSHAGIDELLRVIALVCAQRDAGLWIARGLLCIMDHRFGPDATANCINLVSWESMLTPPIPMNSLSPRQSTHGRNGMLIEQVPRILKTSR